MEKLFIALLSVIICVQLPFVPAQNAEAPPIACPNYFEYLGYGGTYIGKLTLPNVQFGETNVDAHFSQRPPVIAEYYGKLSLFQNMDATVEAIRKGEPISYRIDFPLPNVLPKLTKISVDGRDICRASAYEAPSTSIYLQYTLHTYWSTGDEDIRTTNPFLDYNRITSITSESPSVVHDNSRFMTIGSNMRRPVLTRQPTITRQPVSPMLQTTLVPQLTWNELAAMRQPSQGLQPTALSSIRQQMENMRFMPVTPGGRRSSTQTAPLTQSVQVSQELNAVCGRTKNTGSDSALFRGTVLRHGQLPWLTVIYRKEITELKYLCGGSLISKRTILTAAHCFELMQLKADRIVVYLGRHNLTNYVEANNVPRDIQRLIVNPEYNADTYPDADVALLHMAADVSFNDYIHPICLWSETSDHRFVAGMIGIVAGWGGDEEGNIVSQVPKSVQANIVDDATCRLSSPDVLQLTSERTLCAGKRDGSGPCMGDSGGGLMISRNGRWMLRGVVSAGQTEQQRCNLLEYVIYCDIAKHMEWITRNMLM